MDGWGSQSNSNGPWAFFTQSEAPPKAPAPTPLAPEEDWKVQMYFEENQRLNAEILRLKKQIEFLRESVQIARRDHDLDYQLWLLRDKSSPRLPVFPTGIGSEALAEKVSATLLRNKKPRTPKTPKSPKTQYSEIVPESDPEMEETLKRLLDESTRAACGIAK